MTPTTNVKQVKNNFAFIFKSISALQYGNMLDAGNYILKACGNVLLGDVNKIKIIKQYE